MTTGTGQASENATGAKNGDRARGNKSINIRGIGDQDFMLIQSFALLSGAGSIEDYAHEAVMTRLAADQEAAKKALAGGGARSSK